MVILDPYNEMEHKHARDETLTEYTSLAIQKIKHFAKKYHVHMIIVAHPAKPRRSNDGAYPIPSLYDISDSQHWYNKCDAGIVVHRTETDLNLIKVEKIRFQGQIGQKGEIFCKLDDYRGVFQCLDFAGAHKHNVVFYANRPFKTPPQNLIGDIQVYQAEKGLPTALNAQFKARAKRKKEGETEAIVPQELPPPLVF